MPAPALHGITTTDQLHSIRPPFQQVQTISDLDQDCRRHHLDSIPQRPSHRSLPRASRARHRPNRSLCYHEELGSYWLGSQENDSLQRVYGVSFPDKKKMAEHKKFLEEAAKRDHRKLGREQELFMFHELSPGSAFFLPHGTRIYNELLSYVRDQYHKRDYQEVRRPPPSCHTGHYCSIRKLTSFFFLSFPSHHSKHLQCGPLEDQRPLGILQGRHVRHRPGQGEVRPQAHELPGPFPHVRQFSKGLQPAAVAGGRLRRAPSERSERRPLRPHPPSAASSRTMPYLLPGSTRSRRRSPTCLTSSRRCTGCWASPSSCICRPARTSSWARSRPWDNAEGMLKEALDGFAALPSGVPWKLNEGDGAFYGPKIDIKILDCLNREWQCATIQLDFMGPENFNLEYVTAEAPVAKAKDDAAAARPNLPRPPRTRAPRAPRSSLSGWSSRSRRDVPARSSSTARWLGPSRDSWAS